MAYNTGQLVKVGRDYYRAVNQQGTLERLGPVPFLVIVQLFFLQKLGKCRTIGEVKSFIERRLR